jgi:hypothetical protein
MRKTKSSCGHSSNTSQNPISHCSIASLSHVRLAALAAFKNVAKVVGFLMQTPKKASGLEVMGAADLRKSVSVLTRAAMLPARVQKVSALEGEESHWV